MHGKIWVESELGVGSKFIFEIELKESKDKVTLQPETHKQQDLKEEANKPRIDKEKSKILFDELKKTVQKNRPQLCKPILDELAEYKLSKEDSELFKKVNNLIKKYKFDKAMEILNEK